MKLNRFIHWILRKYHRHCFYESWQKWQPLEISTYHWSEMNHHTNKLIELKTFNKNKKPCNCKKCKTKIPN